MNEPHKLQEAAPVGRVLAGDFSSPLAVLAADELSEAEKREILTTWRTDLERQGTAAEHSDLIATIDEALARLD
jgi:hypothetical protein